MKSALYLIVGLLFIGIEAKSQQDTTQQKWYRHEVGVDATNFFTQFLGKSPDPLLYSYQYSPVYLFSYRYHFKKSNIRFGLGGSQSTTESEPYDFVEGEEKFTATSSTVYLRIGYEWGFNLTKKWQAYGGIDFKPSIYHANNPVQFSNGGYLNGMISSSDSYGISPLLGFRYRITSRLSLMTEASLTYSIQKSTSQRTYKSGDSSRWPEKENEKKVTTKSMSSFFNQPVFLVIAVDI